MDQQLACLSILKKSIQSFGPEAQIMSGNANRFIGDSLVTFERLSMDVVVGKFKSAQDFVNAIRVPFLAILGWCYRSVHMGTRLRARHVLDTITREFLKSNTTMSLSLCREAIDKIYFHGSEIAEKFAFHPGRYEEVLSDPQWRGNNTSSLFEIQCKLETGEYNSVIEFGNDLMELGKTYDNFPDDTNNKHLKEFANFISEVAKTLLQPPAFSYETKNDEDETEEEFFDRTISAGALNPEKWNLFNTDYGSPIWNLEKHGGAITDPYMAHIRRLLTEFELAIGDVPLDSDRKNYSATTFEEWIQQAKKNNSDTNMTLNTWNTYRRRAELLKGVVNYFYEGIDIGDADVIIHPHLFKIHQAMTDYEPPCMNAKMMSMLSFAWAYFLSFKCSDAMKRHQEANMNAVKRMRPHKGPITQKSVINAAIQLNVRDTVMMYNREFLRFWADIPTYDAAQALVEFDNEHDADDEEEAQAVRDNVLAELSKSVFINSDAINRYMDNINSAAVLSKRLIEKMLKENSNLYGQMELDLKLVYGQDKNNFPSVKLDVPEVEDIFTLNVIRKLELGCKRHQIVLDGKFMTLELNEFKIRHARSIWKKIVEDICHHSNWVNESFTIASMIIDMQHERVSKRTDIRETSGFEKHMTERVQLSDKLSKCATGILLYYHHHHHHHPDIETLNEHEMKQLEDEWLRINWL